MRIGSNLVLALGAASLALASCEDVAPGGSDGSTSGQPRSQVEIIDGAQFSATWQDAGSTVVRLAYDSSVAVSDSRLAEIAELMTGCTATGTATDPALIGSIATVRIPAVCGGSAQLPANTPQG